MASKSRTTKPASRAAAKAAARKTGKSSNAAGKTAAKTSSKAVAKTSAKPGRAATPSARKTLASNARPAPAPRRPKQKVAISHHREEDFKADGLRAYAHYRDLGIATATHGLARAHVIRMLPPCNPHEVSKLHTHAVDFQMVYVLKGWVKSYLEGVGETLMKEGSCWTQPPKIRHMILDYSDDVELLEVILPADFKTVELST
ncbi:cupin domain-containing protein [Bradyrhizobium ontarionense]|uniref:Cupin domain-containing protein n=1 Tax=Bradyrhizobium ontarionense TaxID=2898149 RepID=A0ABY3RGM4_9BRAD|nr:cupin domain-containing protein [Bradyrhizobium sp. A19]UFZ06625.1 cupin domain-containing protein [Bradyrhizobium sp. A19]